MWEKINGLFVYVPEHFGIYEVFEPSMFDIFGPDDIGIWLYVDQRVKITIDRLRERYGRAYMNTWAFNKKTQAVFGTHRYRGWRSARCPVGAKYSQHKMGCAGDMVFVDVSAENIREDILAQPYDKTFEYITCIEMEVDWLHFDVRPHDKANKGILQIFPQ